MDSRAKRSCLNIHAGCDSPDYRNEKRNRSHKVVESHGSLSQLVGLLELFDRHRPLSVQSTAVVSWAMNLTANGSVPSHSPAAGGGGAPWATPLLGAILVAMCALGVAGNLYTLAVTQSAPLRRAGSMRVFIINLATADLLYLATIPFVVCTYFARDWFFGETGCRVLLSLDLLTMHASVFVLAAMSLERYRAVAAPFRARRQAGRRHWPVALAVWAAATALTLPMMAMIRLREGRPGAAGLVKRICFPTWTPEAFRAYLTLLFFTSMLLPGLAMGALYAALARHYWVAQANLTRGGAGPGAGPGAGRRRRRLKCRVVGMIFSIVVAYWACFLPFWGWQLAKLFSPEALRSLSPAAHTYVNFFVTCLTYGNSCVNPLLYTLLTRNYRDYLAQRAQSSASSRAEQGSVAVGSASQDP
ncbi:urotensin-2 receptor [Brachyhypopomus gauderio]|uniref:urotensin-2 receptor n=1 Tax=Brachyhypopomus gauderio TaxID=698409 RepID=UPI00404113FF